MRQCIMNRQHFERLELLVSDDGAVVALGTLWQTHRQARETYGSYNDAVERYEQMKVIAALDYSFHLFIENIDEE